MENKRLISMYLKETGNIIKALAKETGGVIDIDIKKRKR